MAISTNVFMPARFNEMIEMQKKNSRIKSALIDECEDSLLASFIQAKEEYIDKILRGLNGLTDDEIEQKLAEFRAFHHPGENATTEELKRFNEMVADFAFKLRELQRTQGNKESLIVPGGQDDEELEFMHGFMQSKLPSNTELKARLLGKL